MGEEKPNVSESIAFFGNLKTQEMTAGVILKSMILSNL